MQNINNRNNYIVNKFYNNTKILNWLQNNAEKNPFFNGWGNSQEVINNIWESSQLTPIIIAGQNNSFTFTFKKQTEIQNAWLAKIDDPNQPTTQLNPPDNMWPETASNSITFTNVNVPFGTYVIKFQIAGKTYTFPNSIQTQIAITSLANLLHTTLVALSINATFSAPTSNIKSAYLSDLLSPSIYTLNFTPSSGTSATFSIASGIPTGKYLFNITDNNDNSYSSTSNFVFVTPQVTNIITATYESALPNKTITFTLNNIREYIKTLQMTIPGNVPITLESTTQQLQTATFSKTYNNAFPDGSYVLIITFINDRTFTGGNIIIKSFELENLPPSQGALINATIPFNFYINPTAQLTDLYFISQITNLRKQVPFTPIPTTPLHNIVYSLTNNLTDDGINLWNLVAKTSTTTVSPPNLYRFGFDVTSYTPLSIERANPTVIFSAVITCNVSPARDINSSWLQNTSTAVQYPLTINSVASANPNGAMTLTFNSINGSTIPIGNYILVIKDRANYSLTATPTSTIEVVEQFFNITSVLTGSQSNISYPLIYPINVPMYVFFTLNTPVIISTANLVNIDDNSLVALTGVTASSISSATYTFTPTVYGRYRLRLTTSTGLTTISSSILYSTYMGITAITPNQSSGTPLTSLDIRLTDGVELSKLSTTVSMIYTPSTGSTTTIMATASQIVSLGVVRLTFTSFTPTGNGQLTITSLRDSFNNLIVGLSSIIFNFSPPSSTLPYISAFGAPSSVSAENITQSANTVVDALKNLLVYFVYANPTAVFGTSTEIQVMSRYRAQQLYSTTNSNIIPSVVYTFGSSEYYRQFNTTNNYYRTINSNTFASGASTTSKLIYLLGLYNATTNDLNDSNALASQMLTEANTATFASLDWAIDLYSFAIFKRNWVTTIDYGLTLTGAETTAGVNQFDLFGYRNGMCYARGLDITNMNMAGATPVTGDADWVNILSLHPNGNVSLRLIPTQTYPATVNEFVILPMIHNTRGNIYPVRKILRMTSTSTSAVSSSNPSVQSYMTNQQSSMNQNTAGTFRDINFPRNGDNNGSLYFEIPSSIANNISSSAANIQYQYRQTTLNTNLITTGSSFNFTYGLAFTNEVNIDLQGQWSSFNRLNDIYLGFTEVLTTDPSNSSAFLTSFIGVNRNGGVIYKFNTSTNNAYNTTSSITTDTVMPLTAWIPGSELFFKVHNSNNLILIYVKTENMPYWLPVAPYIKKIKNPLLPFTNSNSALSQSSIYASVVCKASPQSVTHTTDLKRYITFNTSTYAESDPLFFDRDTSTITI